MQLKRIPYGISDFKHIRENNYYYVDKTRFIPNLEEIGKYLFFIRPRRFGKSLLLSMLQQYYDVLCKEQFDTLFIGTDIHREPTPERHQYMVLTFDFSTVNADSAEVKESFLTSIKNTVERFLIRYNKLLAGDINKTIEKINPKKSASEVMDTFLTQFHYHNNPYKLYVIFDEYDNFANTILSDCGQEEFEKITHGTGFLRSFFNVVKAGASRSDAPIARIFMTGVSPITMDDVTSGFNIATNISLKQNINELLGFTQTEVETMIEYYRESGKIKHSTTELLEIMSYWYNHYSFSPTGTTQLYNTDQVLYFLRAYLEESRMPQKMIDNNARIDYSKLRHLILIDQKGTTDTNGNFSKLQQVIETNTAISEIQDSFPAMNVAQSENFFSLLFYFGLLTITGTTPMGESVLAIPNEFVRRLYYDIIKETYEKTRIFKVDWSQYSVFMSGMALAGQWQPLVEYIAGRMKEALRLRDLLNTEKAHQVFWNVYLGHTPVYQVFSELELNYGFADLVMVPLLTQFPEIKYTYLLEFKYIKPGEADKEIAPGKIEKLRQEAETQLLHYSQDQKLLQMIKNTTLKKVVLIFCGHRLVYSGEV